MTILTPAGELAPLPAALHQPTYYALHRARALAQQHRWYARNRKRAIAGQLRYQRDRPDVVRRNRRRYSGSGKQKAVQARYHQRQCGALTDGYVARYLRMIRQPVTPETIRATRTRLLARRLQPYLHTEKLTKIIP